ncbi:MAG TPA: tetratricopeptide repeat protein [Candidatus Edwardsbacteria bacterium]|nr:tetratricopeptide repeat protein [Candidatus Edwardsbacteria bacterium]
MLTTLIALLALAAPPAESYNQGNACYGRNDYAGAAAAYEQALQAGPNADAFYNLGNARFKAGSIGLAIASYRRAQWLRPRDRDIAANLAFARSYRVDKTLALPGPFAVFLDQAFHLLSPREASLSAALCFLLVALLMALYIVTRRAPWLYAAIPFALIFIIAAITAMVWHGERAARPAVVTVPEVSALSGPGPDYKEILLAHDGGECAVRDARGEWLLVQFPGGAGGWVRKDAVTMVF